MRFRFLLLILLSFIFIGHGQEGFSYKRNKQKIKVPFQFINNLIFIPISVNGEKLTFLLDTGVEDTVLFSLSENEEVNLFNVEKLKVKGLGSSDAIDALLSSNNILTIKQLEDKNHDILIILNQDFNFSALVGIPVNGIIGFHFFKNQLIEINYEKKHIIIHKPKKGILKKLKRKYFEQEIVIEKGKPYVKANIISNGINENSKLLLDSGNSDALWVFRDESHSIELPENYIDDYLGRGFSGNIYGSRARIEGLVFADHKFDNPITTFPDSLSLKNVNIVNDRVGSIGGEILKRFSVFIDYNNKKIYTRPNEYIKKPFLYNKSGINVQHDGLEWIQELYEDKPKAYKNLHDSSGEPISGNLKVKYVLKPVFRISNIRKNSPGYLAGLKDGDKIIKINNSSAHSFTIEKINTLFKEEDGKEIQLTIQRDNRILEFKFKLKSIL